MSKTSKTRLANKTIWALEDMLALCNGCRQDWRKSVKRAKELMDPALILALAELNDKLVKIERLALDARHGKYQQENQE